jgi:ABC-type lipoprotein export system ATPase subunit
MTGLVDDRLVVVSGVSHVFGSTYALRDVNLEVERGRLVVLAGRSGSGKSTLLHLIAGAAAPTTGTVEVNGTAAHRLRDWGIVSLMPQRASVSGELSVRENVELPAVLHGRELRTDLLTELGLAELASRPATDTSLGEQQRTALARALVLDPMLALLDEPTAHQDDEHVDLVLSAMRSAGARGTAILVATHDPRVVACADEVIRLESGRMMGREGGPGGAT